MSRENVELVRRGYEAFTRRDAKGIVEVLHPDVTWYPALGVLLEQ
jgi:ketosteroid isomerase-like protein